MTYSVYHLFYEANRVVEYLYSIGHDYTCYKSF